MRVASLCHATHEYHANSILPHGTDIARFSARPKSGFSAAGQELDGLGPLLWFSPFINSTTAKDVRRQLTKKLSQGAKALSPDTAVKAMEKAIKFAPSFATSPAFSDVSRYGSRGFRLNIKTSMESSQT